VLLVPTVALIHLDNTMSRQSEQAFDMAVLDVATTCTRPPDTCVAEAYAALNLAEDAAASDDTRLREVLAAHPRSRTRPMGNGPWPFVVIDTGNAGLLARSTNDDTAQRVGVAPNHRIVWADCVTVSGFTPPGLDAATSAGPTWLRVRWKHQNTLAKADSHPAEQETAWMYRGYLEPLQHNGAVPRCTNPDT
jgi:hypothetical protein